MTTLKEYMVGWDCPTDDTPNYMTKDGWCADVHEAELFTFDEAKKAGETKAASCPFVAESGGDIWISHKGSGLIHLIEL